jgi:isoleucyl-tRNA synthetase
VLSCESTGYHHLTGESVRFYRDLFRKEGADAWFRKPVAELIPPDLDTTEHPVESLRKGTDILDVWFESGSSHRSVLREPSYDIGPYPAFMYLEGSDQHRGWFQSSILTAVGTTGKAPFETVLTHGFVVDENGRKISKSEGAVSATKWTEQYGADVLRLYVASLDYSDDVRVSERGIKEASEAYRKIRNTFRYLLGNLEDYANFDPTTVDLATLQPLDRWALGQLNGVIRDVTESYERYEFYKAYQRLYKFCSGDLSSFYLDVLKDRLYSEASDSPERRAAQFAMSKLHDTLALLLAPIIPHTAEEVWDFLPANPSKPASVHLADWPKPDTRWDDAEIEETFERLRWPRTHVLLSLEESRKQKFIGSSQEARVSLLANSDDREWLLSHKDLFMLVCGSLAELEIDPSQNISPFLRYECRPSVRTDLSKCERCWNHRISVGGDAEHPTLCDRCSRVIRGLNAV